MKSVLVDNRGSKHVHQCTPVLNTTNQGEKIWLCSRYLYAHYCHASKIQGSEFQVAVDSSCENQPLCLVPFCLDNSLTSNMEDYHVKTCNFGVGYGLMAAPAAHQLLFLLLHLPHHNPNSSPSLLPPSPPPLVTFFSSSLSLLLLCPPPTPSSPPLPPPPYSPSSSPPPFLAYFPQVPPRRRTSRRRWRWRCSCCVARPTFTN